MYSFFQWCKLQLWFISMRKVVKECRNLASFYGVDVKFIPLAQDLCGISEHREGRIIINSDLKDRPLILTTFFHEWGHIYCYQNEIFYLYHHSDDPKDQIKFALRAERYVDKIAAAELEKYDRRIQYIPFYGGENEEYKDFFKKYYDS